jgi:phage shock protein A
MKPSLCVAMVVVWTATSIAMAQTPTNKAKKAPASRATALARDIQALRETVAAQQQQMEAQGQQMDELKSQLQQLLDATQQSNSTAQKVQGGAGDGCSSSAVSHGRPATG